MNNKDDVFEPVKIKLVVITKGGYKYVAIRETHGMGIKGLAIDMAENISMAIEQRIVPL